MNQKNKQLAHVLNNGPQERSNCCRTQPLSAQYTHFNRETNEK